jgi:hypothetical protein
MVITFIAGVLCGILLVQLRDMVMNHITGEVQEIRDRLMEQCEDLTEIKLDSLTEVKKVSTMELANLQHELLNTPITGENFIKIKRICERMAELTEKISG